MPRLRKRWPRQRRSFRVIVPAGGGCHGQGCADPAGRARRGNPHSLLRGRGPRLPGPSVSTSVRARRWRLFQSAGAAEPEGGTSAQHGATLCASDRGKCLRRGDCGALLPPAPAPPSPPFPRPPPGAPAPRPSARGSRMSAPSALPRCSSELACGRRGRRAQLGVGGGGIPLVFTNSQVETSRCPRAILWMERIQAHSRTLVPG